MLGSRISTAAATGLLLLGAAELLPTPAHADDVFTGGITSDAPAPPAADVPLELMEAEGRTRFHLTTRWTPATGAHLWNIDATGWFRMTPGLALVLSVPTAILAPQPDGTEDRFSLGNLRLGVAGGTTLRVIERREAESQGLVFRLGGGFDTYAPTAPLPDDEALTALVAMRFRPLEPGLWAHRALGFRARAHLGLGGASWSVSGELGLTPAFTLGTESDAYLWLGAALRARVVLAEVFEPFVEIGGSVTVASPTLPATLEDAQDEGGFQVTPGLRFHVLGISPAVFFAIQPAEEDGKVTFGLDLAGVATPARRNTRHDDLLDGFEVR